MQVYSLCGDNYSSTKVSLDTACLDKHLAVQTTFKMLDKARETGFGFGASKIHSTGISGKR